MTQLEIGDAPPALRAYLKRMRNVANAGIQVEPEAFGLSDDDCLRVSIRKNIECGSVANIETTLAMMVLLGSEIIGVVTQMPAELQRAVAITAVTKDRHYGIIGIPKDDKVVAAWAVVSDTHEGYEEIQSRCPFQVPQELRINFPAIFQHASPTCEQQPRPLRNIVRDIRGEG